MLLAEIMFLFYWVEKKNLQPLSLQNSSPVKIEKQSKFYFASKSGQIMIAFLFIFSSQAMICYNFREIFS